MVHEHAYLSSVPVYSPYTVFSTTSIHTPEGEFMHLRSHPCICIRVSNRAYSSSNMCLGFSAVEVPHNRRMMVSLLRFPHMVDNIHFSLFSHGTPLVGGVILSMNACQCAGH